MNTLETLKPIVKKTEQLSTTSISHPPTITSRSSTEDICSDEEIQYGFDTHVRYGFDSTDLEPFPSASGRRSANQTGVQTILLPVSTTAVVESSTSDSETQLPCPDTQESQFTKKKQSSNLSTIKRISSDVALELQVSLSPRGTICKSESSIAPAQPSSPLSSYNLVLNPNETVQNLSITTNLFGKPTKDSLEHHQSTMEAESNMSRVDEPPDVMLARMRLEFGDLSQDRADTPNIHSKSTHYYTQPFTHESIAQRSIGLVSGESHHSSISTIRPVGASTVSQNVESIYSLQNEMVANESHDSIVADHNALETAPIIVYSTAAKCESPKVIRLTASNDDSECASVVSRFLFEDSNLSRNSSTDNEYKFAAIVTDADNKQELQYQSNRSLYQATVVEEVSQPKHVSQVIQSSTEVTTHDITFDEMSDAPLLIPHVGGVDHYSVIQPIFNDSASDQDTSESEDGRDYHASTSPSIHEHFEFLPSSKPTSTTHLNGVQVPEISFQPADTDLAKNEFCVYSHDSNIDSDSIHFVDANAADLGSPSNTVQKMANSVEHPMRLSYSGLSNICEVDSSVLLISSESLGKTSVGEAKISVVELQLPAEVSTQVLETPSNIASKETKLDETDLPLPRSDSVSTEKNVTSAIVSDITCTTQTKSIDASEPVLSQPDTSCSNVVQSNIDTELAEPIKPAQSDFIIEAGTMFIAIASFHGQDLDELKMEEGDLIELDMAPASAEEYWWKGTNRSWGKSNGQQGFFPKDFVKFYDPDAKTQEPQSISDNVEIDVKDGENMQEKVDMDEDTSIAVVHGDPEPEELASPDPVAPGTKVIVKYPYEMTKMDELSLIEGELIVVLESPKGGWWKGMKGLDEKSPKTGWFPATLVRVEAVESDSKDKQVFESNDQINSGRPHGRSFSSGKKASLKQGDENSPDSQRKGVSWLRRLVPKDKDKRKQSISTDESGSSVSSISTSVAAADAVAAIQARNNIALDGSEKTSESTVADANMLIAAISDYATPQILSGPSIIRTTSITDATADDLSTVALVQSPNAQHANITGNKIPSLQPVENVASPASFSPSNGGVSFFGSQMDTGAQPTQPVTVPPPLQVQFTNSTFFLDSDSSKRTQSSHSTVVTRTTRANTADTPIPQIQRSVSTDDAVEPTSYRSSDSTGSHNHRSGTSIIGKSNSISRNTMIFPSSLPATITSNWNPTDLLRGSSSEKWQDRFDEVSLAGMSSQDKKRISATWELLQTERDYVRDLAVIIEVFLKPMVNLKTQGKPVINIFANIEQLLNVNVDFLNQIELVGDITDTKAYADAFIANGERFLCYIPYIANQNAQLQKFQASLRSKPEISAFIEEANKSPLMRQIDFYGFLLKPIQRICKYPLLLREILKFTDKSDPDYSELERALDRMQRVVSTVNESARRMTTGMRSIIEVQGRFAEKINIANPNRFLVREDVVYVMFMGGSRKSRKLFLFNDIVILARKDWRDKNHVIEKTPLKDLRVSEIIENDALVENGVSTSLLELEIMPTSEYDPPNRYVIATTAINEKVSWLEAYKSLAKHTIKSKQIGDVAMTSSNRDGGDDEDNTDKSSGGNMLSSNSFSKRDNEDEENSGFVARAAVSKNADLMARIRELEQNNILSEQKTNELVKSVAEKDAQISTLESRISAISADLSLATANNVSMDVKIKENDMTIHHKNIALQDLENNLRVYAGTISDMYETEAFQDTTIQALQETILKLELHQNKLQETLSTANQEYSSQYAYTSHLLAKIVERDASLFEKQVQIKQLSQSLAETQSCLELKKTELLDANKQLQHTTLILDSLDKKHQETEQQLEQTVLESRQVSQEKVNIEKQLSIALFNLKSVTMEKEETEKILSEETAALYALKQSNDNTIRELAETQSELNSLILLKEETDKKLTIATHTLNSALVEKDEARHQLEKATIDMNSLGISTAETQRYLSETALKLEEMIREKKTTDSRLADSIASFISLTGEKEKINELLVESNNTIKSISKEKEKLEELLAETNLNLKSLSQDHQKTVKTLSDTGFKLSDALQTLCETKIELTDTTKQLENIQAIVKLKQAEILSITEQLEDRQRTLKTREALLAETQKQLADHEEKTSKLQALTAAERARVGAREATILDLEANLAHAVNANRDRDIKFDGLERQLKETRAHLSETEISQANIQQRMVQRDLYIVDLESGIKELKSKLADSQTECTTLKTKLSQQENMVQDLSKDQRDFKSRLSDSESALTTLQQKFLIKDVKIAELEACLSGVQNSNTVLKQKFNEAEQSLATAQIKINDFQTKVKKTEASLATSVAARATLEAKVADIKAQVITSQEYTTKLERERKDLMAETEGQMHELASLTKEIRQIREALKDAKTDHEKLDAQRVAAHREVSRELAAAEEKWKAMLDKEKRDHASDYAALVAEFQGYRVSTTAELARIRADSDASAKQLTKDNEERLHRVREQSDARIEQIRTAFDHERETALSKLDEERNVKIQRLTQALESTKSMALQTTESLKRSIQETQERLKDREQTLAAKEETLKAKEAEAIRLSMDLRQQAAEILNNEAQIESIKTQYRNTMDNLERDLQDKSLVLLRKESEAVDSAHKASVALERVDSLEKTLQRMQRDFDDRQQNFEDTIEQMHEIETTLRLEITTMSQKVQQLDQLYHDTLEQLELKKALLATAVENNRRDIADTTQLKETIVNHKQLVTQLSQERDNLKIHIRELSDTLDRKTQECSALVSIENQSKETIRNQSKHVHDLELNAEKTIMRVRELEKTIMIQEKTISDIRQGFKETQAEWKERQMQLEVSATKRHEGDLEAQRLRFQSDLESKIQKLEDAHIETVSKLSREAETASKQVEVQKTRFQSQIEELTKANQAHVENKSSFKLQLDKLKKDTDVKLEVLEIELKNKLEQLDLLKKRVWQLETDIAAWRDQNQQLLEAKKEMTQQFNDLMAKTVLMDDELIKSRKLSEDHRELTEKMLADSEEHGAALKALSAAQTELQQAVYTIQKLETSVSSNNKRVSQYVKQLASVQMTLDEIGKIVDIPPFKSNEDFMDTSLTVVQKECKGKIFVRMMDNCYLISVVEAVNQLSYSAKDLMEKIAQEKTKVCEYQDLQRLAEQELSAASGALEAIEDRIKSRDEKALLDLEAAAQKLEARQRVLDATLRDKKQLEANVNTYVSRIATLEHDKNELEQTFIHMYERLKSGRESQALDAKHVAQEISGLLSDKSRLEQNLVEASRQVTLLSEKIYNTEHEQKRQQETFEALQSQKSQTEKLLEEANKTSNVIAIELDHCREKLSSAREEIHELKKEKSELNTRIKSITEKLTEEIGKVKEELIRSSAECTVLRETSKEHTGQVEKLEEKLTRAEQREIELRERTFSLSEELKREKVHSMSLKQECDQISAHKSFIESKLQPVQTHTQHQHIRSHTAEAISTTPTSQSGVSTMHRFHIPETAFQIQANHYTHSDSIKNASPRRKLPMPTLDDPIELCTPSAKQPRQLPTLHPLAADEAYVAPLLSMVKELIAYEPEIERQQGMLDRLDKLKVVLKQQATIAPTHGRQEHQRRAR
ncbi:Rho guanine nucleotide exchange factor 3 [Batrachochytrium dendrobatidis]